MKNLCSCAQELEGTTEPGLMFYGPAVAFLKTMTEMEVACVSVQRYVYSASDLTHFPEVGACSRSLQWEHALLLGRCESPLESEQSEQAIPSNLSVQFHYLNLQYTVCGQRH